MPLSSNLTNVLSVLADCYTPILLFITLVDVICNWRRENKFYVAWLIYAVMVVYLWMFIDERYQLWLTFGLDYSTHSAAAFALVAVISIGKTPIIKLSLLASLIAYEYLMNLLGYHTWSDMVSTLCVIAAFLVPLAYNPDRKTPTTQTT